MSTLKKTMILKAANDNAGCSDEIQVYYDSIEILGVISGEADLLAKHMGAILRNLANDDEVSGLDGKG